MQVLPQDADDAEFRRISQKARDEICRFAQLAAQRFGAKQIARIKNGIEYLIDEAVQVDPVGLLRPSFFFLPDLKTEPFLNIINPKSQMGKLVEQLQSNYRAIAEVTSKLENYREYVDGRYRSNKFGNIDKSVWTSIPIFIKGDWRLHDPELAMILSPFRQLYCDEIIISRLASNMEIPRHVDHTNYELTLHFGLSVPEGDCGLCVGNQQKYWENGKAFVFCDGFVHESWNKTSASRDILLIDVWHPDLTEIEIICLIAFRLLLREVADRAKLETRL